MQASVVGIKTVIGMLLVAQALACDPGPQGVMAPMDFFPWCYGKDDGNQTMYRCVELGAALLEPSGKFDIPVFHPDIDPVLMQRGHNATR